MSRRPSRIDSTDHGPAPPPPGDLSQLKLTARGLSRVMAALYIGVSASKFDELVKDGRMPAPKRVDGRKVWDKRRLDEAFEALPDDGADSEAAQDSWADFRCQR